MTQPYTQEKNRGKIHVVGVSRYEEILKELRKWQEIIDAAEKGSIEIHYGGDNINIAVTFNSQNN